MDNWTQIVITIVGVLGSGAIWKYLEARLKTKSAEKQTEIQNSDGVQYRDDLKNRVRNLESFFFAFIDTKINKKGATFL